MLRTSVLFAKNACTKCGENAIDPQHHFNKDLGYCQDCAKLLDIGKHADYISIEELNMGEMELVDVEGN
jgi:hypothetical protein